MCGVGVGVGTCGGGGRIGGDVGRSIVWVWVSGVRGVRWRWQ